MKDLTERINNCIGYSQILLKTKSGLSKAYLEKVIKLLEDIRGPEQQDLIKTAQEVFETK